MSDESVGSGQVEGESESTVTDIGYSDPFDFSEDKPQSVLDSLEFNLNDDGEVEISGLDASVEEDTGEEQSQEVTSSSEDLTDEVNPFVESASDPKYKSILDENTQLKERLAKIEERLSSEDQSKSKATLDQEKRAKLEAAGFMDEQIDAILEITTSPEPQKEIPKESKETDEQKELREERTNRELAEVLETYNGKDGNPTVQDMKLHIDYVSSLFGAELLKHPIPDTFKLAENAPFISYLIREEPDRMKNLTLPQVYTVSTRLRKLYYKKNPQITNKFYHLYPENHKSTGDNGSATSSNNEQSNTTRRTDVTNSDINRLAHEKNEISRNVPGGEVETETEINERRRPKSAREVATASIMAAFGETQ